MAPKHHDPENSEQQKDSDAKKTETNFSLSKNSFGESSIGWYLEKINKIDLLSRLREDYLARAARMGNSKAKEELIKANLRFVVSIAKKYQTSGIGLLDLINEGNMGLIRASERFDPDRGYHFISYAVWWIRQAIILAISQKGSFIRLPINRNADIHRIEKVNKMLEEKLGREPTANEIAQELDVELAEINTLRNMTYDYVSLDARVGETEESSFFVMVEDKTAESPMKKVEEDSLTDAIQKVIATLSPNEQEILKLRFGLDGNDPMSLQQIGRRFKLSKERIRQIEKKALRRLRQPSRNMKLQVFMHESDQ